MSRCDHSVRRPSDALTDTDLGIGGWCEFGLDQRSLGHSFPVLPIQTVREDLTKQQCALNQADPLDRLLWCSKVTRDWSNPA